jgi:flagellar biosynthetic protein FliQ
MNEVDALELMRAGVWTVIVGSGPGVAAAMVVGLVIALFQALTQIQEATLTFVPKIIAVFVALLVASPFMGAQLNAFAQMTYAHIEKGF